MLILLATGMLIGFGAAAQVSIKLGEKKTEEAERVLGNAALLSIVVSVVLTVVGLLALNPVLLALPSCRRPCCRTPKLPANHHLRYGFQLWATG